MAKGYGVVVNVETAAQILQISKSTAYAMANSGTLPGVLDHDGRKRVSVGALEQYLSLPPGTLVGDIEILANTKPRRKLPKGFTPATEAPNQ